MRGGAIRHEFPVIVPGAPCDELRRELQRWDRTVLALSRDLDPARLPDLRREGVLWLSPRAQLDDSVRRALASFRDEGRQGVGVAAHVAAQGDVVVPLGDRVVIASPGAVRLGARGPIPVAGVAQVRLDCTVRVTAPPRVGEHLQAINDESTAAAALGAMVHEEPSWSELAWAPLWGTLRGWFGARGNRGRAFTIAFLEGFAVAATAAKLWEATTPDLEAPS